MKTKTPIINSDHATLAEDVRTLLVNGAEFAGEEVSKVRQRMVAALDRGRQAVARVRATAVEGTQATGQAVCEHPYRAVVIALAAGVLIGDLAARRVSRRGK